MNSIEYKRLKQSVEKMRADANKAQGAVDSLLQRLRKEFKVKTIKDAKALLVRLEEERDEVDAELETALKKFKKDYGHAL